MVLYWHHLLWVKLDCLLSLELRVLHNRWECLVWEHSKLVILLLVLVLLEFLLIELLDMRLALSNNHVLYDIILCVKNDVP